MNLENLKDKKYYNLLITADEEAWFGKTYKMELSRFLEFTDTSVRNIFQNLENENIINEIQEFPCLFLNEIGRGDFGYIGSVFCKTFLHNNATNKYTTLQPEICL